jgi:hypothetical protein
VDERRDERARNLLFHHRLSSLRAYVSKLLRNGRVVGYLAKNFQELLFEFQRITEAEATAA